MRSNGPLANKKVAMGGHGWPGGLVASWPVGQAIIQYAGTARGQPTAPAAPANRQKPATHYGTPHNRLGRHASPARALKQQERRRGC